MLRVLHTGRRDAGGSLPACFKRSKPTGPGDSLPTSCIYELYRLMSDASLMCFSKPTCIHHVAAATGPQHIQRLHLYGHQRTYGEPSQYALGQEIAAASATQTSPSRQTLLVVILVTACLDHRWIAFPAIPYSATSENGKNMTMITGHNDLSESGGSGFVIQRMCLCLHQPPYRPEMIVTAEIQGEVRERRGTMRSISRRPAPSLRCCFTQQSSSLGA